MASEFIVLRDIEDDEGSRYLTAEIAENGDLVIAGFDEGLMVERVFGCSEYEWLWTIAAGDIPILIRALGGEPGADVLNLLTFRFTGDRASELKDFLDAQHIPHELWAQAGEEPF